MKVLITGATGFVGSAVLRQLLKAGHDVQALVRPAGDRRNLASLEVEVVEGDLGDPQSLRHAVKGCRALFHVAADYRLWAPEPAEIYRTNVAGTEALMLAAAEAGVERVVHTSSVATLGLNQDGSAADEEAPVTLDQIVSPYKRSKYLAEEVVRRLARERDLGAVIVNPSTPIGPRDRRPTPTGRIIIEAASGRMPAYVDTGLNLVHVDDVARGHLLAFERGVVGQRYILGGQNMSLREILATIAAITGNPGPRIKLPHNLVLPLAYGAEAWARVKGRGEPFITVDGVRQAKKLMYFSSDKARRELGYTSRPAQEALFEAIEWFRAHGFSLPPPKETVVDLPQAREV
ncbi:MAG: hopanoid-associated sugar epimerase [Kiloniellales bacterium]